MQFFEVKTNIPKHSSRVVIIQASDKGRAARDAIAAHRARANKSSNVAVLVTSNAPVTVGQSLKV